MVPCWRCQNVDPLFLRHHQDGSTAYAVNFFWYSATQIYLLLRNAEDGAEFDEVFVGGNAAAFGLPALKTDENGVPRVDDSHHHTGQSSR